MLITPHLLRKEVKTMTFELWDNVKRQKLPVEAEKKEGKYWISFCPFHQDKNRPNLHIDPIKKTYNCYACGKYGFLYNPNYKMRKKETSIERTYDYQNEKGELLFQVIRYHPKKFILRRLDNQGSWIYNLQGINPVLYHLPELIQSTDPVLIVEGEKDVENLKKWNLKATTNPMGAGKWRKEYNQYLKDKEVILIPDHDSPGFQHCRQIGTSLKGIAKSIRWLELPGLEEKEDVSDWINKGNSKEKLLELVKGASDFSLQKCEQSADTKKNKNLKNKTKTILPNLIHLVEDQGKISYLFYRNGQLVIEDDYIQDDIRYSPKQDLPMKLLKPSILKRSMDIDMVQLVIDIDAFLRSFLEMPNESHYQILSLWIFHTYLIEKFNTTPVLYFYGVKETGKSRAGEVLSELAFRAQRLTSITEATLFRSVEMFKPTLFIDEIKLWGKGSKPGLEDIIKTTYKRGLKVSRINQNKTGEEQAEYFDTFTPLVICTTENLPDIIENRCICFIMQKNINPDIERAIDERWANDLRERLTIFRAIHYNIKLPESQPIARRRLNEIMFPLYQTLLLIASEKEQDFITIVSQMQKNKENEEGMSLEAEIVKAIDDEFKENGKTQFLTQAISQRLNKVRSVGEEISDRSVCTQIKRLGFQKIRFKNGRMGFQINEEKLESLKANYQITDDPEGSEGSEASEGL